MSLEESMKSLAESNHKLAESNLARADADTKLAGAMSHYASVMQAVAAGNPSAVVAPQPTTDATAEKPKGKGGRKSNAEKEAEAAAKAADNNGGEDAFGDGEPDPFADDKAEPETPALTAEVIRGLVLKVKEKNKDHALGLLKKLGVSTLGQIEEKDYPKVVELAAKVGVTL
jgi:hypothetical protein